MKAVEGIARYVFLGFFLSHIPFTILVDGQASPFSIPYPSFLTDFLAWYASTFNDPNFLGKSYALWFRCFITAEFLIQLPYFFVASNMLLYHHRALPEWFRLSSLIYGAQAMTAIIPILAVVMFNPDATSSQRAILSSVYMPYLLVPLALVYYMFEPTVDKTTPVPILKGAPKTAMLAFFLSHVPITIFIDSQALGTSSIVHPQPAVALANWYVTALQDPLMQTPCQLWFRSLVFCECSVQLPFFFIAIQQLRSDKYSWWFPNLSLVYGAHVVTTMIPIFMELWTSTDIESQTAKAILTCIYSPYAIFPAFLAYWAVTTSRRIQEKSKKN